MFTSILMVRWPWPNSRAIHPLSPIPRFLTSTQRTFFISLFCIQYILMFYTRKQKCNMVSGCRCENEAIRIDQAPYLYWSLSSPQSSWMVWDSLETPIIKQFRFAPQPIRMSVYLQGYRNKWFHQPPWSSCGFQAHHFIGTYWLGVAICCSSRSTCPCCSQTPFLNSFQVIWFVAKSHYFITILYLSTWNKEMILLARWFKNFCQVKTAWDLYGSTCKIWN